MDLTQLQYFQALAEHEHMTKAAATLHVAQPALSRSLRNLEQELGLLLFDRVGKNIYLNVNGRILLKHTRTALRELEVAREELEEQRGLLDRKVSLSMHAGSTLLPNIIGGFQEQHPDISLQIIQQDILPEWEERCDISVFSSILPAAEANTITLMEEEICLAMPASNPLSSRPTIKLSDVAQEPFICLYKGKGLRTATDEYCRQAGFAPHIILESDSPWTVRSLIALGVGCAFIPTASWRGIDDDPNVRLIPISHPHCIRYVNMSWRNNRFMSSAAAQFRSFLIAFFAGLTPNS